MNEAALQRKIQRKLKDRGAFVRKIHGGPNQPQLVDLVGCYRGHFFALEVKLPTNNRLTDRQKKVLIDVRKAGGVGMVVRSPETVDRILNAIDRQESKKGQKKKSSGSRRVSSP